MGYSEAYLDDVVLGGKAESFGANFAKFRDGAINIGLRLNVDGPYISLFRTIEPILRGRGTTSLIVIWPVAICPHRWTQANYLI